MTDQELKDLVASTAVLLNKTDKQLEKLRISQNQTDEQMKKTDEQMKKTDEKLEKLRISQNQTDEQMK